MTRQIWYPTKKRPHKGDIVYIKTNTGKQITGIYTRASKNWYYLTSDSNKNIEYRVYKENVKKGEVLKRQITKIT